MSRRVRIPPKINRRLRVELDDLVIAGAGFEMICDGREHLNVEKEIRAIKRRIRVLIGQACEEYLLENRRTLG
jgi:hypothetical protein